MEHVMKLNKAAFESLKNGTKVREYRLNDKKRKNIRIDDTIRFIKLPDLDEEFVVDVKKIEIFPNWHDCYAKYFDEDFKDRYDSVDDVVRDIYERGYYTEEESKENDCVVFTIKKHRVTHLDASICYLKENDKILMIKYAKKWDHVYAPPGGKIEEGETPLECIKREFEEETGLTLIEPKLQGISCWKDSKEGIIFIYVAEKYEGTLTPICDEGILKWIDLEKMDSLPQFDQNKKYSNLLFKDKLFEAKFLLDDKTQVIEYEIKEI